MSQINLKSIKKQFGIIGNSDKLDRVIEMASSVAPTSLSALIMGENGSGKESIARIIHFLSNNKHGKFISINCGAIPEGTIDSELFGHDKGAFTGAIENRKGYFEEANNGTIFLDEIGDMPLNTQTKLLRVLENHEIIHVGSSKILSIKTRVIAATNVNLQEAMKNGKFREDLYYRISTVPITIPPLRERKEDIFLLFTKFANDFANEYNTSPIYLNEAAKVLITTYKFPGNIRQLKNLVEQMSVLEINKEITEDTLQRYLPENEQMLPIHKNEEKPKIDIDLLYKLFWDLNQREKELEKLVYQIIQFNNQKIEDHKDDDNINEQQNQLLIS